MFVLWSSTVFSDICLYFAGDAATTIPETMGEFEKKKNHEKRTVEILSKKNNANCKKNIVNQLQNFDWSQHRYALWITPYVF